MQYLVLTEILKTSPATYEPNLYNFSCYYDNAVAVNKLQVPAQIIRLVQMQR